MIIKTLEEAIEVLKDLRSEMEDARDRISVNAINMVLEAVKEPKRGEWKCNRDVLELICSVCGESLPFSDEYDYETNFCPNCGADMRKGERK